MRELEEHEVSDGTLTEDCLPVDFKYDTVASIKPFIEVACMSLIIISVLM